MTDEQKDALMQAVVPYYGIYRALTRASDASESAANNDDLQELERLERRQEIEMRMAERQAKVAQELAIADRIRTAEQVEIEEFYDVTGEGSVGATVDESALSLGAKGKGQKVARRVYRFTGVRPPATPDA
ncbi:hypothetical protein [Rubrivirga litoralis]|uniref:Uncharacterized protein n=1 Tax=Rubrivirga litoralis TaxID=3075598 RepID=A0ABU3BQ78_9BACT|nr:hypothetical protein [Rubrivirga sp. F394]MDT0631437.1 hypothetical protein [Rubrivirga sp. F394]